MAEIKYTLFANRLIEFDKSLRASFIPRLLSQKGNIAEIIPYVLDRYMLSISKDCVMLPDTVFDSAYERDISMISHNVDNGHMLVHFTTGGYADFLNLNINTMVEIANKIMNSVKFSEQ